MLRGHAEALAPMVQRVMTAAGISFRALQRVGVTTGPGTFTGQRVGLAFARALGVALKVPVVGTTTLHAMAEEALTKAPERWSITVADAKRSEVYLAAYAPGQKTVVTPRLVFASEVVSALSDAARVYGFSAVVAGTAAPLLNGAMEAAGYHIVDSGVRQPNAIFVARLTANAPHSQIPRPLYLRPPDAKIPPRA